VRKHSLQASGRRSVGGKRESVRAGSYRLSQWRRPMGWTRCWLSASQRGASAREGLLEHPVAGENLQTVQGCAQVPAQDLYAVQRGLTVVQ
jgi:hypothetical protein